MSENHHASIPERRIGIGWLRPTQAGLVGLKNKHISDQTLSLAALTLSITHQP